jgi:Holliday junction resolvase RusA-like endonuclease
MHWAARDRYMKYWRDLVRSQINNGHFACHVKSKVSISQMRKQKLDKDNLYSSCKPVLDALVYWSLIKDDSMEWIDLHVVQTIGKEKLTIVEIEEI